jgi:hypothetical protein
MYGALPALFPEIFQTEPAFVFSPMTMTTLLKSGTAPVEPTDDVSVTDPPEQNVVGPDAEMVGIVGFGVTLTTVASDAGLWHPAALVTLTM